MNISFYAVEPPTSEKEQPKATLLLKVDKKDDTFIVHKESFEFTYPISALDTYKHWVTLYIQPRVDFSKQQLMIADNIGVGTILLRDSRDLVDIVSKLFETLAIVLASTQPDPNTQAA
jgi:hypothetical protein